MADIKSSNQTTTPRYAYSLNGQTYCGAFATREQAQQAAFAAARLAIDSPQSVYVGRREPANLMADSHARSVLAHMQARAREQYGDEASAWLTNLPKPTIEDLDQDLAGAVAQWLAAHDLLPTFDKIDAIGEYPLPPVAHVDDTLGEAREVHEIGSGDSYDGL